MIHRPFLRALKPLADSILHRCSAWGVRFFLSAGLLWLCVVLFMLHAAQWHRYASLDRLDAWIYDARLADQKPLAPDPNVVIVDIDEASLGEVGRWPWSRVTTAQLASRLLQDYGVRALGFDMAFTESEGTQADLTLIQAVRNQPVVLGYYLTSEQTGHRMGEIVTPVFTAQAVGLTGFRVPTWSGFGANVPFLVSASGQAGFFNTFSDDDGVIRSVPLLAEVDHRYYESLALALYRRWLAPKGQGVAALPPVRPELFQGSSKKGGMPPIAAITALHIQAPALPALAEARPPIPVDEHMATLVAYRGPGGPGVALGEGSQVKAFQYVSAKDVLAKTVPAKLLRDKMVLVGSSAPTVEDLRVTPVGVHYPGVEVHASVLAGLIHQNTPYLPDNAMGVEVFELVCLGAALIFVLTRLSAMTALWMTAGLMGAAWLLQGYLFKQHHLVLPLASSLICMACLYVIHMAQGFVREAKRSQRVVATFAKYLPPQWVTQVVQAPVGKPAVAKNAVLTVMFSDMRGFTQLAETLSPTALQTLLNEFFTQLSEVIAAHNGTIDKFMGDCVMAFWGAPAERADHAACAVRCALSMMARIETWRETRQHELPMPLAVGIGIHTGLMCVGDIGSDIRRSYTVIGNAVNIASRLQGRTKAVGTSLLISKETWEAATREDPRLRDQPWQDVSPLVLDGVEKAVSAFAHAPIPSDVDGRVADSPHQA